MEKIAEKLTQAGYKLTKPRLAVLRVLRKAGEPVSARELHARISHCDQASVYRNLHLFEAIGLVKAETVDQEKYYCAADKPHHHIICRKCGKIENIPCTHKFNRHKNFSDIEHQLTLYGVCGKCRR